MCGVVEDGILPGLFGFEAGQSAVGDILAWFIDHLVPPAYHRPRPRARASTSTRCSSGRRRDSRPGESGLLALDWWNGNRSMLVDADLSGLLIGATLSTTAPEIYRALIESTAFGTRVIVEAFERSGVAVNEIVACGGLPERNRLLMRIFADVTGREIAVAASSQTPGPRIGHVRRGRCRRRRPAATTTSRSAASRMAALGEARYRPDAAACACLRRALSPSTARCTTTSGVVANDVMKRLRALRARPVADAAVGA